MTMLNKYMYFFLGVSYFDVIYFGVFKCNFIFLSFSLNIKCS